MERERLGLVLSGGGARGAYEAGVLSYVFDSIGPQLAGGPPFDVVSGTSVGAIHAAFTAATADLEGGARARRLRDTWGGMTLDGVMRVTVGDLFSIPLRLLGSRILTRSESAGGAIPDAVGGLVDVSPLERLVDRSIPWKDLGPNLAAGRPGALCLAGTEVNTGTVTIFMQGPLADTTPWAHDLYATAVQAEIGPRHVRASAAIPFLFPAVRVGDSFYCDGGIRLNTPLSPALRLQASKVLVIGLKHPPRAGVQRRVQSEHFVTQPAFIIGKLLDALLLDQIEHDLQRLDLVNQILAAGSAAFGPEFQEKMNEVVRPRRGVGYRPVQAVVVRPSDDLGRIAAHSFRRRRGRGRAGNLLSSLVARAATLGVPEDEADLLSYLYFDRSYTRVLLELGREDARRQENEIAALLGA